MTRREFNKIIRLVKAEKIRIIDYIYLYDDCSYSVVHNLDSPVTIDNTGFIMTVKDHQNSITTLKINYRKVRKIEYTEHLPSCLNFYNRPIIIK